MSVRTAIERPDFETYRIVREINARQMGANNQSLPSDERPAGGSQEQGKAVGGFGYFRGRRWGL